MMLWLVLLSLTVTSCTAAGIREREDKEWNPAPWLHVLMESRTEELKTMEYNPEGCKEEGESCRRTCQCCGPTSSCDSDLLQCFYTSPATANLQCYAKWDTCGMVPEAYCPGVDEPFGWWKAYKQR